MRKLRVRDRLDDEEAYRQVTRSQEARDKFAARRHAQRETDHRNMQLGTMALQSQRALEIARTRHGCRGVLAPLWVAGGVMKFECIDCRDQVEVTAFEASL